MAHVPSFAPTVPGLSVGAGPAAAAAPGQDAQHTNSPAKGHKSLAPHPLALHSCLLPLPLQKKRALQDSRCKTGLQPFFSPPSFFFLFYFTVNVSFVYGNEFEKKQKWLGKRKKKILQSPQQRQGVYKPSPSAPGRRQSTYFIKLKQNSTSKTVSSVRDNQQAPCSMFPIDHQQTM